MDKDYNIIKKKKDYLFLKDNTVDQNELYKMIIKYKSLINNYY